MKEKITKNLIPISIVIIGLLVIGFIAFTGQSFLENRISGEEASKKAIDYIIEQNLLSPGITVVAVDFIDEGSVYKIKLEIKEEETLLGAIDSYVTKDGKFWFPEGFNMTKSLEETMDEDVANQPVSEAPQAPDLSQAELREFIGCLEKSGFVIYGDERCPYCQQLVSLLGGKEIVENIYVDCEQYSEICYDEKGITGVPTIFINNQEYIGARSFEGFSKETGCIL